MRMARLWKKLLGVDRCVVESVALEGDGVGEVLVASVRLTRSARSRCGRCARRCPGHDQGEGRRRWRTLDFGSHMAFLEADAPRVRCRVHGVVVAAVPWARHGSRFTRQFEDFVAWNAAHAPASAVAELCRTTWRSVTGIIERVVAELSGQVDRLEGLRRIGIDEIAHRKGQRYITCVIDHDTGLLVWASKGRNQDTVRRFFADLGETRARLLTHVSADGAEWIHTVVAEAAPQAKICLDPFHLMAWATKAMDETRRELWRQLKATSPAKAKALKGTRWALLTAPVNQSRGQRTTVAEIARTNKPLYRGYLLVRQLAAAVAVKGPEGRALIAGWLAWARRSRLPAFIKMARTVEKMLPYIRNTMDEGLSNARSEATNTHLRVLTRRSYGFHSPNALIAMAMLTRGGLCPPLPGH